MDREFWLEAGKMGLIGVEQSVEKGGWGKDFYTNIIGLEEQVYSGCPGGFAIQNDLVMPTGSRLSDKQKECLKCISFSQIHFIKSIFT